MTVIIEQDGVQHGFLKVPYSGDDSAWGAVMVPVMGADYVIHSLTKLPKI